LLPSQPQVGQRHRIEVVIGQGNKSKTDPPQINDFVDHALILALPGLLPIGPPNAAKRAMLRASANGLHRGPHILIRLHQVPSRGQKLAAFNPTALIDPAWLAREAIGHDLAPRNIAISLHHGVSITAYQGLFRKQRSVNPTIDHPRAALARHSANLISA